MKLLASLALAALAAAPALAQTPAPSAPFTDPANLRGERVSPRTGRELPIDGGLDESGQGDNALALQQMLRKLNTRASLMLIVAHPDDEDGGMLTFYSRGLGARVAILTLTRGEGGQNAVTGDFEDALGLLRTQELLSEDRYLGVDTQMFGTEVDFGFSKTKSESFAKWDHDRVLYDAVRAVRLFRPLVIASVFIGGVTDGHGQHQVSAEIAQEVFKAAGDPTVFPELTREGILPWQPLKMYARVPMQAITSKGLFDYATDQYITPRFTNYITGETSTTPPTPDITIHEGEHDPLLTTCAANPADLPYEDSSSRSEAEGSAPSLSSNTSSLSPNTSSLPPNTSSLSPSTSSLPPGTSWLSSRSAAEGSAFRTRNCRPLTYVQFARIGLGLQKSQIGANVRLAPAGAFDISYHLYGSRVCPTGQPNPTPSLCQAYSSRQASTQDIRKAPTARLIPAQGNALGTNDRQPQRAESPTHNTPWSQPNFFDGIDTTLQGMAALAPGLPSPLKAQLDQLASQIDSATSSFGRESPASALAPDLAAALRTATAIIQSLAASSLPEPQRTDLMHELRIKQAQLNDALATALGLTLDATAHTADPSAHTVVPVWVALRTATDANLTLTSEQAENSAGATFTPDPLPDATANLTPAHSIQRSWTTPATFNAAPTRPYFTRSSVETPVYTLLQPELRNAPATPPALTAWETVEYRGATIRLGRVVHAEAQPVSIVPAASIALSAHAQVLPSTWQTLPLHADVRFDTEAFAAHPSRLDLNLPAAWSVHPRAEMVTPAHAQATFTLSVPADPEPSPVTATLHGLNGQTYTEGFRPVGYGDLPRTNFYTPATDRIVPVDLKLPPPDRRRIAYLPGTGDAVPEALASIGLAPKILTVADLTPTSLAQYDTVILGVRTYNAHPDLHGAPTQALLDYARSGGNVLIQYQTGEFTAADAPYPLELGYNAEKVVDETAPVKLLDPRPSALLAYPNKITPADFNNWIEERGHGFLASWDPHYTALTETHDPGAPSEGVAPQLPQRGGLVTTPLGKGRWTYCAFALYRQLPEAVPGAFRLFVNIIAP